MLIALIQPQIFDLKIENNLINLTNLTKNITNEVDWIIFPELFLTGFDFSVFNNENIDSFCNENKVKGLLFMQNLANTKMCAVEGSLLVQENGKYYNRHYFITPDTEIYYDKQKLFSLSDEAKYLSKGTTSIITNFKGWNINLKTCYDVRFPDICRNKIQYSTSQMQYTIFDYDIMTFVASWPQNRTKQWQILLKSRAIENMSYVIGVNRQGIDSSNIQYKGDSCIINTKGEFLQPLSYSTDTVFYYDITKENLDKERQKFPVYFDW